MLTQEINTTLDWIQPGVANTTEVIKKYFCGVRYKSFTTVVQNLNTDNIEEDDKSSSGKSTMGFGRD